MADEERPSFAQAFGAEAATAGLGFGLGQATSALGAKRSYKYWKRQLKKGPSYQMEGLRRAGLNPILAAGGKGGLAGGANMTLSGQTTAIPGGRGPGLISSAREAAAIKPQLALLNAQVERAQSDASIAATTAADKARDFKAGNEFYSSGLAAQYYADRMAADINKTAGQAISEGTTDTLDWLRDKFKIKLPTNQWWIERDSRGRVIDRTRPDFSARTRSRQRGKQLRGQQRWGRNR